MTWVEFQAPSWVRNAFSTEVEALLDRIDAEIGSLEMSLDGDQASFEVRDRVKLRDRQVKDRLEERIRRTLSVDQVVQDRGLAGHQCLRRRGFVGKAVDLLQKLLGGLRDSVAEGVPVPHQSSPCSVCGASSVGEPPAAADSEEDAAAGAGPQRVGPVEVSLGELVDGTPVVVLEVDGARHGLTEFQASGLAGHLSSVARAIRRGHFPTQ